MSNQSLESSIANLEAETLETPFVLAKHNNLVVLCRATTDYRRLHSAYVRRSQNFLPSPHDVSEWERDLSRIGDDLLRNKLLQEMYDIVLEDYPVSKYWAAALNLQINCVDNASHESITRLFAKALQDCCHDYENSTEVWNIVIGYHEDSLKSNAEKWPLVWSLFTKRLSYPHPEIEETLSRLSSLVLAFEGENYENKMKEANKIAANTRRKQQHVERAELSLQADDPDSWKSYLETTAQHSQALAPVSTLFYRFLVTFDQTEIKRNERIGVWLFYIQCCHDFSESTSVVLAVRQCIRAFPDSGLVFTESFYNCAFLAECDGLFEALIERINAIDLWKSLTYIEKEELRIAIITQQFRRTTSSNDPADLVEMHKNILQYLDEALAQTEFVCARGLRFVLHIYMHQGNAQQAHTTVDSIILKWPQNPDSWLLGALLYSNPAHFDVFPHLMVFEYFGKAFASAPCERLCDEWLLYENLCGSAASNAMARNQCRYAPILRPTSNTEHFGSHSPEDKVEQKRSRENFCVKVSGLAAGTTEEDVREFFANCGEIYSCNMYVDQGSFYCALEFANEQQVLLALSRTLKTLRGAEIQVMRLENSTIFLANYPPSMLPDQIRTLVAEAGTVTSVRFPVQRANMPQRRFCYVEYADSRVAEAAVALLNNKSIKDERTGRSFALKASVSRPSDRKQRDARYHERKVRLVNLPYSADESELRAVLQSHGAIESIQIPHPRRERPPEHHNDGVAVVLYESLQGASNALAGGSITIRDRTVHITRPQDSPSRADTNRDNKRHTVTLGGIDDKLTLDQCEALLAEKIGSEVSIVSRLSASSLVLGFKSESEADKAAWSLEGYKMGELQVVVNWSSKENTILKVNTAPKPTLMIPSRLKRRRQ